MDMARLEELFAAASALAPPERRAFLGEACGDDEALRTELEALLACDARAEGMLEGMVAELAEEVRRSARTPLSPSASPVGSVLGAYEIVEPIGAGGMGEVYLAVRADDQYVKRVALKLIRHGAIDGEHLRLFQRERQALADLEHPGIARLLDGGTTDDGRPYLVMEYVDGRPIDEWCDAARLPVRERLKLFQSACAAVHFAHRNLVVHLDIKPANVLVTREGVVKLVDFGTAKYLSQDREASRTTLCHLTPRYSSPERLQGGIVTTASDVYSLGALLYELLSGRPPFEPDGSRIPTLVRRIVEDPPPRPSDVLRSTGPSAVEVARRRSTTPERLRSQLAGDLDNIVSMALRKEPDRRYASAEQLSEDVQRHLDLRPVLARRDTLAYRATRFARRNLAAVLATVLVVASLATGWLLTRSSLAREREEARQKEYLITTARGLLDTLPSLVAGTAENDDLLATLDVAAAAAERLDFDDPRSRVEYLEAVAREYSAFGLDVRAAALQSRALELAQSLPDRDPLLEARLLQAVGRHAEALAIREAELPAPHRDIASSLCSLAAERAGAGDLDEARELYRRAQEMLERLVEEPHPSLVRVLLSETTLLHVSGANVEALETVERAEDMARRLGPPGELLRAEALKTRGWLQQDMGRYEEAEADLDAAIAIYDQRYPQGHPQLGEARFVLAMLYKDTERFEEAEELLLAMRVGWRDDFGWSPHHLGLAKLYADWGRWEEAEPWARKELEYTQPPISRADRMTLLGRILLHLDRLDEARELLEAAHEIRSTKLPEDRWERYKTASVLGHVLARLGRFEEAEVLLLEALPHIRASRGEDHWRTAQALYRLVDLYERWGDPEEARRYREQITPQARRHRIVRETIGPDLERR